MAKHTPGPWNTHRHYQPLENTELTHCDTFDALTISIAKEEMLIGEVSALMHHSPEGGRGYPRVSSIEEVQANALLIAASPELLEQLKLATDHIHDLRIILEQAAEMGVTLHMCGVTYDHNKALAAIAKATGVQA